MSLIILIGKTRLKSHNLTVCKITPKQIDCYYAILIDKFGLNLRVSLEQV